MLDVEKIKLPGAPEYEPERYEDSYIKEAVDDLDNRISRKIDESNRSQATINIILIVLAALTLTATILVPVVLFVLSD